MQAEQFGVTMNNSINTELLVQLITKTLIELAVLRKQLHTLQSSHNAMTQYFGYDVKESFEEVAFTVTVPKADKMNEFSMDQFVKESTQKVEVSRIEKKEIGAHRKYMLILQKMAGIITAVFWRKLVKGGVDLADQMKSLFNKQHQTINDIDKHQDDFEDWLEEYERGFTTTEGYQGDPAKPWGDDYEARPRTKIVGKLDADVQPPTES
jgi:tRNA uridine 5-carbamoylmethylation protein Kti12